MLTDREIHELLIESETDEQFLEDIDFVNW